MGCRDAAPRAGGRAAWSPGPGPSWWDGLRAPVACQVAQPGQAWAFWQWLAIYGQVSSLSLYLPRMGKEATMADDLAGITVEQLLDAAVSVLTSRLPPDWEVEK